MKTWTDVFFAAIRRGDDPFRAMDIADAWKVRQGKGATPHGMAWRLSRGVISDVDDYKDSIPQEEKMECHNCHADDEILIICGDRKLRCAPCAAAAGYCMGCGKRCREPICARCEVTIDDIAESLEVPVDRLLRGEL